MNLAIVRKPNLPLRLRRVCPSPFGRSRRQCQGERLSGRRMTGAQGGPVLSAPHCTIERKDDGSDALSRSERRHWSARRSRFIGAVPHNRTERLWNGSDTLSRSERRHCSLVALLRKLAKPPTCVDGVMHVLAFPSGKGNALAGLERHSNRYGSFFGFFSASWRACRSFRHFAASSGLLVAS
jgi:hypothetical protein